ncbi:MAG: tRNA uridine 5-oxyacetic acid(34) methyltransferase CmoM, partial [Gammaproteobacteria bacterium]|nr:tRNA uridine 5-oxyacetic acid(34) methyltransferase CmoM [Gammaproteobacteria bacterium]
PTNPIEPDDVDKWLINNQITVLKKTGIRVLFDYLNRDLKAKRSLEDIIEMESIYAHKAPFNMMGRYIHYICQLS